MAYVINIVDLSSGENEELHVDFFSEIIEILEDHKQVLHNHVITITPHLDSERLEDFE